MINPGKGIRWWLFGFALIAVILYPFFEKRYQATRQNGWTTYFPTKRQDCDLSQANIVVDKQQRIWVLGQGGCDFYRNAHIFANGAWEELQLDEEHVTNYQIDEQGQLWRLIENRGKGGRVVAFNIEKLNNGEWSTYVKVDAVTLDQRAGNAGFSIDKQGRIWLSFTRLPSKDKPALWTTGISIFDGHNWETYTSDNTPSLASERLFGPRFDSQNRAWFFGDGKGIKVFDGANWASYSAQDLNLIEYGNLVSLNFDNIGKPWIATQNGFLVSVDDSQVIDLNQELNPKHRFYIFPGNDDFHFAFDRNGRVWVAYWADAGGQIISFDDKSWTILTKDNSVLSGEQITELKIDEQENVWVVTPSGIHVFNPDAGGALLKPDDFWIRLRGNERAFIGTYWLIPFLLSSFWFALLFPKGQRLSAIGLLLGVLEGVFLILALLSLVAFQGFNRYSMQPMWLLIPFGLVGLVISLTAAFRLRHQDKKERRTARLGIVFSLVGLGLGVAWYVVAAALLRY